jgi:hypothetical protein
MAHIIRLVVLAFLGVVIDLGFPRDAPAADRIAASCSAAAITTAINQTISTGGGTVFLPVCSADDTWTASDYINVSTNTNLRLMGAGINSTIIGYADGQIPVAGRPGMYFGGSGLVDLSGFTFRGSDTAGIATGIQVYSNNTQNLRIHHMRVQKFKTTALYVCQNPNSPMVIDHCEIGDQFGSYMYGIRTHGTNDASDFKIPAPFGANNTNALFIEDNVFDNCYHSVSAFAVSNVVFRHNIVKNPTSHVDGHGPCYDVGCNRSHPAPYTGTYIYEMYDNEFYRTGGWCVNLRGGTGIITDNKFYDCGVGFRLEMESCSPGANCNTAQGCPHSSTDTSACYQSPYQYWIWNNTMQTGSGDLFGKSAHECIRQDYEYYLRAPQTGDQVSSYTKYEYPHPIVSGAPPPPPPPPPDKQPMPPTIENIIGWNFNFAEDNACGALQAFIGCK